MVNGPGPAGLPRSQGHTVKHSPVRWFVVAALVLLGVIAWIEREALFDAVVTAISYLLAIAIMLAIAAWLLGRVFGRR